MKRVAWLGQRIIAPRPFLSNADQSRSPQIGQMAGCCRLRHSKHGHQIAYAQLAFLQQMQDSKPRAIGERAEETVDWQAGGLQHVLLIVYGLESLTAMREQARFDVLVVGAGPTGLTLACQLVRFGVPFRIIDKQVDRTRESRALAVQARSLEVLQTLGLGDVLAGLGRTTTRLMLHVDRGAPPAIDLGNIGRGDTRFPYILFVSQANTEAVLVEYLESRGVVIERSVELARFQAGDDSIGCILRHRDGREESCRVRYLGGCDGAHSTVRKGTTIPFEGGAYPQTFALGDVEVDGPLEPGAIHAFGMGRGFAMFFPLGHPTTWRIMAMEADDFRNGVPSGPDEDVTTHDLSLAELQTMIDDPTFGSVRLRDPAWLTRFRLHHRQAARYQQGCVF